MHAIHRVTFRPYLEARAVALDEFSERVIYHREELAELKVLAQVVGRERDRAARVLLFGLTMEIRGKADLGFDLLLAVAEVRVGDQRRNHATIVATRDLERATVVVALVLLVPAHAV